MRLITPAAVADSRWNSGGKGRPFGADAPPQGADGPLAAALGYLPGRRRAALDTRTPYTLDFDGPDGGKNAHYMLRWLNAKGQKGPWSETATATIGA